MDRWESLFKGFKNAKPHKRVLGELNKTTTVLRDLLDTNFTRINVNSPQLAEEVKSYVAKISPEKVDIVKQYKGKLKLDWQGFGRL